MTYEEQKEYNKRWRQEHKEHIREYQKQYRKENKAQVNATERKRYAKNREKHLAYQKEWRDRRNCNRAELAREIFKEIEKHGRKMQSSDFGGDFWDIAVLMSDIAEIKKKYTEGDPK